MSRELSGRVLTEAEMRRLTIGTEQPAALSEGHQAAIHTALGIVFLLAGIALTINGLL